LVQSQFLNLGLEKQQTLVYVLQDAAEYNVQTKIGVAILMDTLVMNKATGDMISLYDAYEFDSETKQAKLKDGYEYYCDP